MKLWTIQPVEVYEILKEKGYFICDPDKAVNITGDYNFNTGYIWLIEQMKQRIGNPPENIRYPIWAWYIHNWKNSKPDLRCCGLGNKGEKSVCLELEVPNNKVLCSDFDLWHYVLNNWYIDDSKNQDEWERITEEFEKLPTDTQDILKKDSWEKIFNIEPFENSWTIKGRYVQATFWILRLEYVKSVRYFTAR